MGHFQAFGVFQKIDEYIFRKSAYIQWGDQKESIGSFLLLNPGGAEPSNVKALEGEIDGHHRVEPDPTMKQMIKLVEKIYKTDRLNGRIYIYNLFSLRNPEQKMRFQILSSWWRKT